jgi:YceI-like domain
MKRTILIFSMALMAVTAGAQKFMTKSGYIGFYSHTPVEDIKADNNQVAGVIDAATGDMVFQALIKSFHFERALMEEHFNENYMESDKYPKATFKGKITDMSSVTLTKKGTYNVTVEGDLTIHNTTNRISVKGTVEVTDGGISASAKFPIVPEDYKVNIPGLVRDKIAKNMEVTVQMKYTPLENK